MISIQGAEIEAVQARIEIEYIYLILTRLITIMRPRICLVKDKNRPLSDNARPTASGRLCEFDVGPVSRQKQIRWMAQRQLSGAYSQRQPPASSSPSRYDFRMSGDRLRIQPVDATH